MVKSKGILTVNGFLSDGRFTSLYESFLSAAKKRGVGLSVQKNTELLFDAADNSLICGDADADFMIFWDKDVRLACQLEALGMRLYNRARGIELCDDKSLTHIALAKKLPMPKTVIVPFTFPRLGYADFSFLEKTADELGFPMVIKEVFGSFGLQVYLAHDIEEAKRILIKTAGTPVIMQKFISESAGRDARLYVVGTHVEAAMIRKNTSGDFRANVAQGGATEPYAPTEHECDMAILAVKELGLDFGGVDILFSKDGPVLCEVNSNAHFAGMARATGADIAGAIIDHIVNGGNI